MRTHTVYKCRVRHRDRMSIRKVAVGLALCCWLGLALFGCAIAIADVQISPSALAVQIEQGSAPLILDVRTAEEFAEGHVPGAVNIEYRQIPAQVETLRDFEDKTVVVYCERGVRAGRAEAALIEADFTSVVQLKGDMAAWRAADLPVEVGGL